MVSSSRRRYLQWLTPATIVIALPAVVAFALLAALFAQGAIEAKNSAEHRTLLHRSLEIRSAVRSVFSSLQEAESAQLGFILTGDAIFLEPFNAAAERLPVEVEQLHKLTEGDPEQKSSAHQLGQLTHEFIAVLSSIIAIHQADGAVSAREMIARGDGRRHMDRIRAAFSEMLRIENEQIVSRSALLEEYIQRFRATKLAATAGMLLMLLTALGAAIAHVLQRQRTDRELRTARDNAEMALAKAQEASRSKTEFLASMSHEIRTPLNGVIGYTELLFDTHLSEEQREYLDRIHFAGSALVTVVDDVLDFSKIEAGRIDLHPHAFALVRLVDNAVSVVRRAAELKGLEMRVLIDQSIPPVVVGDEARIRQVLLNLLNNAVKFTPTGRVDLLVDRPARASGLAVRFTVRDTGIGIPTERQSCLFLRFSQADPSISREFGGSGLGLAISKRLVELMGGEIGFESELGKGSTFWCQVPLVESDSTSISPDNEITSFASGVRGRILLVEDLLHNRELAQKILTVAGHEVDTATNGAEAVAAVKSKIYDLVLMDVQMPVLDGVEATKQIRDLPFPTRAVPIIAMSANVLPQQVRSFKEAGMNDHVGKPFKGVDLLRKVEAWIGARTNNAAAAGATEISELCRLMGRDWVCTGLAELQQQIARTFGEGGGSLTRQELAANAHAIVSHAALFGFVELSRLCGELEVACREGKEYASHLEAAAESARGVKRRAAEMLHAV